MVRILSNIFNFTIMQKLNGNEEPNEMAGQGVQTKTKKHLRLVIDLKTWHLTPFLEKMNLQHNVSGHQFGFLCFVFIRTVQKIK